MMILSLKNEFETRLRTLVKHGLVVHHKKIGKALNEAEINKIQDEAQITLPEEMIAFYREVNGLELSWTLDTDDQSLFGSISILPLQKAIFGEGPARRNRYESAFEDMLWNDFYSPAKIKALKQHRVFESVEGESAYITFQIIEGKAHLFYVEEETIKLIQVSFTNYVKMLFQYLGTGNLREHLRSKQWEKKIKTDSELTCVVGLL